MKSVRQRGGYTWTDYQTNTDIVQELNMTPVLVKIQGYKRNWLQHVNRMPRNRLQNILKTTDQKAEGTMGDI
jgi:hypothetical protein